MKGQQRKEGKKMATAAVVPIRDRGEDLARKTVLLIVRFSTFGNSRRVSTNKIDIDADKALIRVQKTLLDSKELDRIDKANARIRRELEAVCLPFESAIRLVPLEKVPEAKEICDAYEKTEFPELVEDFIKAYPKLCETAAKRLRNVYNASDYPSKEYVKAKFGFSYQFASFGVPGQLKELSMELFKSEQDKAARQFREAADVINDVRRETLSQLVSHLAERLESDEKRDGKPKIFKQTAVTKLQKFLDEFEVMNVTDDAQLATIVKKGRKLLSGVSYEGLKTTDTLREKVKTELDKITVTLEAMVENKPSRKFRELE